MKFPKKPRRIQHLEDRRVMDSGGLIEISPNDGSRSVDQAGPGGSLAQGGNAGTLSTILGNLRFVLFLSVLLEQNVSAQLQPSPINKNGGFEEFGESSGVCNFDVQPTEPRDEQAPFFVLCDGAKTIRNWEVFGETLDWFPNSFLPVAGGELAIDLNGTPGPAGIRQTFPTMGGQIYRVEFDLAGNPAGNLVGADPVKRMQILAAGQAADFTFTTYETDFQNMGWVHRRWEFQAKENDPATTLRLKSLTARAHPDDSGDYGPVIDNVHVYLVGDFDDNTTSTCCHPLCETVATSITWTSPTTAK